MPLYELHEHQEIESPVLVVGMEGWIDAGLAAGGAIASLLASLPTPIGAGCRVCERDNCPQRAFPALGRALDINEHRSTVSPYLVRQP